MSYAATVIKLYPPVISSHPASFQLLLLLWHLTLPGVLLPYCDTILCCCYFHSSLKMYLHAYMRWNPICRSLARLSLISQSLVIVTPFAADGEYFRQTFFNAPQCIIIAVKEIYIFLYFFFFHLHFSVRNWCIVNILERWIGKLHTTRYFWDLLWLNTYYEAGEVGFLGCVSSNLTQMLRFNGKEVNTTQWWLRRLHKIALDCVRFAFWWVLL